MSLSKAVTHESYQAARGDLGRAGRSTNRPAPPKRSMRVESAPKGPLTGRRVETLGQAQLLSIAAEINIDGNNLRHIYETHMIGERGLGVWWRNMRMAAICARL